MDDDKARELALEAAERLFTARGIQTVGMDDLRNEAGISLKRIYGLFPSKDAIVEQVLVRLNRSWMQGVIEFGERVDSPRDKLLAVFDFLEDRFRQGDYRGCVFINAFGELGPTAPLVAEVVRRHKADFQGYVSGLVESSGAPASLAPQLVLLAEGAQSTAGIFGDPVAAGQARAAAATLIDAALVGARA
ncbi:TetR/AcrR family transcriptional regulator [Lacisediminihabitans profunda]|uniref:TetR/AcrR family transcriptional regulator n=1 Tax=Lacisediminihabitans profunda TaxID=2594790 RepID=A0A5C8UUS6_9MICO|nr:TetR/AcrR family transcriptional regulator [Lacisediminihabitans profunda]TXN31339.1 TetR/AcrR family transcriptional regulator [Lacisediminihabitans profunda]